MQKARVFNLPPGPFNQRLISPRDGEVKKTFYLQNNKWDLNVEHLAHSRMLVNSPSDGSTSLKGKKRGHAITPSSVPSHP